MEKDITDCDNKDIIELLIKEKISNTVVEICKYHELDGQCLLCFEDRDFHEHPFDKIKLGDKKRFMLFVKRIQKKNRHAMHELGLYDDTVQTPSTNINFVGTNLSHLGYNIHNKENDEYENKQPELAFTTNIKASKLKPEVWKTAIALGKLKK